VRLLPKESNSGKKREYDMIRKTLSVLLTTVVIVGGPAVSNAFAGASEQDEARAFAMGIPYTNFNWNTAHAQDRGCNACHGDHLAADVSRIVVRRAKPELHGIFVMGYDIPMRVEDCLPCHANSNSFADSIHARHAYSAAFVSMGPNCNSCHTIVDGKLVLYDDETRYSVMNGVQQIPTPAFSKATIETSAAQGTTGAAH